jgi:hypothetical protein
MNRLERVVLYALVIGTLLFLAACMTPAQQTAEVEKINAAYEAGRITYEQWKQMLQEVYSQGGIALWQFLLGLVGIGSASVFGGYKLTMAKRGPTELERQAKKAAAK